MSKKPKAPPPDEDESQSQRFLDTVRELEAAGDLDLESAEPNFDRAMSKITAAPKGDIKASG